MKTSYLYFSLMIGCIWSLLSCGSDAEKEVLPPTIFQVEDITFDALKEGQQHTIEFEAGSNWTAILPAAWLKITPTSGGAGKASITVWPTLDNTSSSLRSADLKIMVDGESEAHVVHIYQAPVNEVLELDKTALSLTADERGMFFTDTLTVISNRNWTVGGQLPAWLTYTTLNNEQPEDGKLTSIKLIMVGEYDRLNLTELKNDYALSGAFQIKSSTGAQIKQVTVAGSIWLKTFADEEMKQSLDTVYIDKDPNLSTTYIGEVFMHSNILWSIHTLPEWLETPVVSTNANASGNRLPNPLKVNFIMKSDYLSVNARKGLVVLYDNLQKKIYELPVKFMGTSSDFMEHDLQIPAYDANGEDFKFEALAQGDPHNPMSFTMRTSVNYTSIANAPFHLIALKAVNGIVKRELVNWLSLSLGDPAKSHVVDGIYTKELYLNIADSNEKEIRDAYLFIVPKNIGWEDLFEGTTATLKDSYTPTLIMQKSNPEATYTMSCDNLQNGAVLEMGAQGTPTELSYKVTTDATQFNVSATNLAMHATYGWVNVELQRSTDDKVLGFKLKVAPNTTGFDRDTELSFEVYRGLNVAPYVMFKFKIKQSK